MESWHKHSSSLRHERSGRECRPQSERRNNYRNRTKRTTRRMVGLRDGMLVLFAERALQNGRWKDSIREQTWQIFWFTIKIFWSIGWVHPDYHERQVNSTSDSKDNAWRFARIRIFRNLRQKFHKPRIIRTRRERIFVCIRVFETSKSSNTVIDRRGWTLARRWCRNPRRWQQGKHNRRSVVYAWRIYKSTPWRISIEVFRHQITKHPRFSIEILRRNDTKSDG